jgi:L-aspartate oxidase
LLAASGERFMPNYDASRLELAPRDVVARAIQDQMLSHGNPHVWLDISHKPSSEVLSHFPNIAVRCKEQGIDITKDPIPVLPAQHYMCGGVAAGLRGETSVQGLFACGEVACSGLHGANRLASNSLLEGLVFADRAAGPSVAHAEYASRNCGRQLHYAAASSDFSGPRAARPLAGATAEWVAAKRAEVRGLMWEACGIVRRTAALQRAQAQLAAAYVEVKAVYKHYGVNTQLVELMNLVTVAELIVSCALQRRESRGLHYSADYPIAAADTAPSVISSSLKSRLDLEAVRGSIGVSSSNGFVSLISPGGAAVAASAGAASTGGASAGTGQRGVGSAAKKGAAVRDLSVRSFNEPEK